MVTLVTTVARFNSNGNPISFHVGGKMKISNYRAAQDFMQDVEDNLDPNHFDVVMTSYAGGNVLAYTYPTEEGYNLISYFWV